MRVACTCASRAYSEDGVDDNCGWALRFTRSPWYSLSAPLWRSTNSEFEAARPRLAKKDAIENIVRDAFCRSMTNFASPARTVYVRTYVQ